MTFYANTMSDTQRIEEEAVFSFKVCPKVTNFLCDNETTVTQIEQFVYGDQNHLFSIGILHFVKKDQRQYALTVLT